MKRFTAIKLHASAIKRSPKNVLTCQLVSKLAMDKGNYAED